MALFATALCACRGEEPARQSAPPAPQIAAAVPAAVDSIVGRVRGEPITASELDEAIRLPLYDLDRARFELRAQRLHDVLVGRVLGPLAATEGVSIAEYVRRRSVGADGADDPARARAFVASALDAAPAEELLEAPEPPLVAVSVDDDPLRGPTDAAVTIVEFVDYQSPYCRGMQPVLRRLLDQYPRHLRLVVRDFPLPIHRDAARAAEAADCAGAEGGYWPYHDVLLQEQDDLTRPALDRFAQRVGLDRSRFAACLDDGRMRAEVAADAADAVRLGVAVAPTSFVNGRYMKGPQTFEALQARIDAELARLGIDPASARVTAPTATSPAAESPEVATPTPSTAPPVAKPQSEAEAAAIPSSVITLSPATVQSALARRTQLARDLERPPIDLGPGLEGRRLMRIRRVRPGSLYDAMGLVSGDVLMTVDGVMQFDRGDALFDALRDRPRVTIRIIRRGLPLEFEYSIR